MRNVRRLLATIFVFSCSALAASQAIATYYTFRAEFDEGPFPILSGQFQLTVPPTGGNIFNETNGITLTFNQLFIFDGNVGFNYFPSTGQATIGSTLNGVSSIVSGTNDFFFGLAGVPSSISARTPFEYQIVSLPPSFRSLTSAPESLYFVSRVFEVMPVTQLVPTPAAFPLFGSAVALLGYFGWRNRTQSTVLAP